MSIHESQGMQHVFSLAGPIFDTLEKGGFLAIDELDVFLHPLLLRAICDLFHSKKSNPHNAQLIFVSHNTSILDRELFRRDQVWFLDKNKYGESELFSLADFKDQGGAKVRNDANYEKRYLEGLYGGVAALRDLGETYGDR